MTRVTPRAAVMILLGAAACNSPAPEAPADTAWGKATVAEELRIGVEFGAEEYMFGSIRSIAVAADGTMYVSDYQANIVRMYDPDGAFVREIGRQGQGPGEYAYAPFLRAHPDGTLIMRDSRSSRLSFFSAAGEYVRSFPATIGSSPTVVGPQGNLYLPRVGPSPEVVEYSSAGEELGRVQIPPRDQAGTPFLLGWENVFSFPVETASAWSPLGYAVTGRNDAYDIELRKLDGIVHLRRDLEPVALTADELAEWRTFRQGLVARLSAANQEADIDPIPGVKPYFRAIQVGDEGRIWVWRYVAAEKRDDIEPLPEQPERPLLTWREPWTYDVFEPDTTFLGSVVVPELLRPFVFRGDQIWGAITDQDGVEQVVRLRVVPEAT
jgi:hypothetical protein